MAEIYNESDEEVEDIFDATTRYIFEGDDLDEPYDIRGLGVYAVISALREIDEKVDTGELAELTAEQEYRLHMVEYTVDLAVNGLLFDSPLVKEPRIVRGGGMQFFPFGHNTNQYRLPAATDIAQLKNIHAGVTPKLARRKIRSNRKVTKSQSNETNPDDVIGPVVSSKIE